MKGTACVVLAAGASRRMGLRNKLLIPGPDGRAMVAHVAHACVASGADEVVVVTGHDAPLMQQALAGLPVRFTHAADHAEGMAASLRAGIAALGRDVDAAAICLGDMPLVSGALIARLLAAHDPARGAAIVVPVCAGRRGNPVVWDSRYFAALQALRGDAGARGLIDGHGSALRELPVLDEAVLTDFDTPQSVAGWEAGQNVLF